jgi:hypothetical protein
MLAATGTTVKKLKLESQMNSKVSIPNLKSFRMSNLGLCLFGLFKATG